MEEAGLPEPEYIETPNTVKLILRNNIDERTAHRNKKSNGTTNDIESIWEELDDVEKAIVTFIKENGKASRVELENYTKKSRGTVINRLHNLMDKKVIKVYGEIHDPKRIYELM